MSIDVGFRGVMLFVKDGAQLERVVVPLAEGVTPRDGSPGLHADGSPARVHRAGVVVFADGSDDPQVVRRVQHLRDPGATTLTRVTLTDGSAQPTRFAVPGIGARLEKVVNGPRDIHLELLPDLQPPPSAPDLVELNERVAAMVHTTGGRIMPSTFTPPFWDGPNAKQPWSFPREFNPAHTMRRLFFTFWYSWRTERPTATLTVEKQGAAPDTIQLVDGQCAYVYNHDVLVPSLSELNDPDSGDVPSDDPVDVDFRWTYQLLRPRHRQTNALHTLPEWMAQVGASLPAPYCEDTALLEFRAARKGARDAVAGGGAAPPGAGGGEHPSVSTCFPGLWP